MKSLRNFKIYYKLFTSRSVISVLHMEVNFNRLNEKRIESAF